jgi:hypothetical protein
MKRIFKPTYPSVAELKAHIKQRETEAMALDSTSQGNRNLRKDSSMRDAEAREWTRKIGLKSFIE